MATNYATKYSNKVDERFAEESKAKIVTNNDYDFDAAESIVIYSIQTSELNDYNVDAESNRYGTVANLGDTTQTEQLTQDKSFTFAIDKKQLMGTNGAYAEGMALDRQIREKIVPFVDTYAFSKMASGSSSVVVGTMTSVESCILDGSLELDKADVPMEGRYLIISNEVYSSLKKEMSNRLQTEMGDELRKKGVIELFDGMPIVRVNSKRLPANVDFMIAHKSACVLPIKLEDYITHENPPGINGTLVEGRIRFDAFVLNNKKKAIYVHKHE